MDVSFCLVGSWRGIATEVKAHRVAAGEHFEEGMMDDGEKAWGTGQKRLHVAFWVVIALLIAVIAAGAIVFVSRHSGAGEPVEIIPPSGASSPVEVYLSGAVGNEGIYTFSQDSNIEDVLQRAGGVTEELDPVTLKIRVLHAGEDPFDQEDETGETKVNINTASTEELQTLYGIGPVKAQAIIDYRNANGFFHSVDELINVSGIGPKTLEKIRDQVTVVD
ncbi:MAG: ComEA family DNA-binding protein [Dehalococcoidia bacterium]|nr:ComEA family DNA-binding protein [Dehalococcoidia bacterium]